MSWHVPGYTEISELGRGSSGRVVLAEQVSSGLRVAIKYLAPQLRTDPRFVAEFRAEARTMAQVDHAHIVELRELVDTPEGMAIVMELVDGVSLRAMLREHGPTEPEAALVVLKGSLLGLAAAHAAGVVHRDYKPENVLVGRDGRSKLADFGIATRVGGLGPLAGTPPYMAPEQWSGSPASPATDIYAATATFFECLVGRPPFQSSHLPQLRWMHEQKPAPLHLIPQQVQSLIERGLAKQTSARPMDAATFLRELETAAIAGYGKSWEKKGLKKLARRSLLLAALSPLAMLKPAGAAATGALLGIPAKVGGLITAGIATAVIGSGVAWYAMQDPVIGDPASAASSPSAQSSATPSDQPSPSASPMSTASASPAASPVVAASGKPSTAPLPVGSSPSPSPARPNTVTTITLSSFCWFTGVGCTDKPSAETRASVFVKATQPQQVSVHFRYMIQLAASHVTRVVEADREGEAGQPITHVADMRAVLLEPCSYVVLTVSVTGVDGTLRDFANLAVDCDESS